MDDLEKKLRHAVSKSGFPLEQKVGHLFRSEGWIPFHSVHYQHIPSNQRLELDLLTYKIVKGVRVEYRVSCRRSESKPWVFFTEASSNYTFPIIPLLVLPLPSTYSEASFRRGDLLSSSLSKLRGVAHPRRAFNYTTFSGSNFDADARTLMSGAIESAASSHFHYYPPAFANGRATLVCFLTIFEGRAFECSYDHEADSPNISEIDYCYVDVPVDRPSFPFVDVDGKDYDWNMVFRWYPNRVRVEVVTVKSLVGLLRHTEQVIGGLSSKALKAWGRPWE